MTSFALASPKRGTEALGREEVGDHVDVFAVVLAEFGGGRIDADQRQPVDGVLRQQGPIVAADVHDGVPGPKLSELRQRRDLCARWSIIERFSEER